MTVLPHLRNTVRVAAAPRTPTTARSSSTNWEKAFMARNAKRRAPVVDPKVREFLESLPA